MGIIDRFKDRFFAATAMPKVETPKVPRRPLAMPSFLKSAPNPANVLPRTDRALANTDVTTFRTESDSRETIRKFVAASPDLSSAVFAYLRTGITDSYVAVAKNLDGSFNVEATASLQAIIQRFDVLGSYSNGYSSGLSIRSLSESLAKELVMYGACACELILDKTATPSRIQPISVLQIQFKAEKDGTLNPIQKTSTGEIDLDFPNFFYISLDQDIGEVYASSPIESAIQAVLFSEDFVNDLRRVIKKVIHPRQLVVIDEEKLRASIPADIMNDPQQVTEYFNTVISGIETKLNNLRPEDALVMLSSIGVSLDNNGNSSLSDEYNAVQGIANARLASGAKVMPATLGHEVGSSNVASTSSLLFMKNAHGVVTSKLNEIYSRVFTLAVRLMGYDVVVEFKYSSVELRPETELIAFKQTAQQMTIELLSYGFITDEEASLRLTGKLPPKGFKPLSGTQFKTGGDKADTASNYGGSSNDGSTLNKAITSDAPTTGRGGNKKADTDEAPAIEAKAEPTFVMPNIHVAIDNTQQATSKLRMQRDEDGNLTIERLEQHGS